MSTLSQFFQGTTPIQFGGGAVRYFLSSGTMTVPSSASYIGYGVIGGGAGLCVNANCIIGGGGGGFSWWDGAVSCASSWTLTATVGAAGTCYCNCSGAAGSSCVTGGPTAIYATGGYYCGGSGCGGLINTKGGGGGCVSLYAWCQAFAGAGAGGLIGDGGKGAFLTDSSYCNGQAALGGGGYGSGGGGGATVGIGTSSFTTTCIANGGAGGSAGVTIVCTGGATGAFYYARGGKGISGDGGSIGGMGVSTVGTIVAASQTTQEKPTSGYIVGYADNGNLSQAKTYFGASGGGGASYAMCGGSFYQLVYIEGTPGAAGGGGGAAAASSTCSGTRVTGYDGGFGAGAGVATFFTNGGGAGSAGQPGIGGGSGLASGQSPTAQAQTSGGQGIVVVEYWS